jgi:hypothetical protein
MAKPTFSCGRDAINAARPAAPVCDFSFADQVIFLQTAEERIKRAPCYFAKGTDCIAHHLAEEVAVGRSSIRFDIANFLPNGSAISGRTRRNMLTIAGYYPLTGTRPRDRFGRGIIAPRLSPTR